MYMESTPYLRKHSLSLKRLRSCISPRGLLIPTGGLMFGARPNKIGVFGLMVWWPKFLCSQSVSIHKLHVFSLSGIDV